MNYYNEFDPFAAQWLLNLMSEGHIPMGAVDTRDFRDVTPNDLAGFTQHHFFAGIGGWPLALRLAGWPDTRPVWSGSCPCQSFSAAGKGAGFDDERHLWPSWNYLIGQCKPPVIFGEQVSAAIRFGWLDLVCRDLEAEGYTVAPIVLGAHSAGAPHIRQRLWWVAERTDAVLAGRPERWTFAGDGQIAGNSSVGFPTLTELDGPHTPRRDAPVAGGYGSDYGLSKRDGNVGVGTDASSEGLQGRPEHRAYRNEPGWLCEEQTRLAAASGATRGFWADADWWWGRDEKYRPIEPGVQPLAHGVSNRVGRLRGYGNAIVPAVAAEVIKAWWECRP